MATPPATAAHEACDALAKDVARCVKKHSAASAAAADAIDKLLHAVAQARAAAADGEPAESAVLCTQLARAGEAANAATAEEAKALSAVVGKLGKTLDKHFVDVGRAWWNRPFDPATLQQVIARHLYREGRFDVGDLYSSETGAAMPQELQAPFSQLHGIVASLRAHDVAPALAWVDQHRLQLARAAEGGEPSSLEWQLLRLKFLSVLCKEGRGAAVRFARVHFAAFTATQADDVKRLMGSLMFADRLDDSPYARRDRAFGLWAQHA